MDSHVPNVVTEKDDGKVTIYSGKPIKIDRKMSYYRSDVQVIDMDKNMWYIVDSAISTDRVREKEEEKIDKYLDLAAKVTRQFNVNTIIVLIVLRALSTVPAKLLGSLEKFRNRRRNSKLVYHC